MAQRVVFAANDGTNGVELWITDGTPDGTVLLKDIAPSSLGSYPSHFAGLPGGRFVFVTDDGTYGSELWVSDGTADGTYLLKDIAPGEYSGIYAGVESYFRFAALGDGRLVFAASDGVNGHELWVTDGTADGTYQVKDINPGPSSSDIRSFGRLGDGRLVFTAFHDEYGLELWVTDGTEAGTYLLKDINTGYYDIGGDTIPASSWPSNFATLGDGRVVFSAYNSTYGKELWITDGTPDGTVLLKDIDEGSAGGYPYGFALLADGRLVFAANDGVTDTELWVTDGTEDGTYLLKDIQPGGGGGFGAASFSYAGGRPTGFTALGDGRLVFSANDGTNGWELWITDGTEDGTYLLADIDPSIYYTGDNDTIPASGDPWGFAALGDGRVVFAASDGINGHELWVTDGTAAGTYMVADINPNSGSSFPFDFTPLGDGRLVFTADDGTNGWELWITDGTEDGTYLLAGIDPSIYYTGDNDTIPASGYPEFLTAVDLTPPGTTVIGTASDDLIGPDFVSPGVVGGPPGAGPDSILGLDGNDTLDGGAEADTLDGGAGFDIASYRSANDSVLASLANPAANTGEAKGDVYIGIEGLYGSRFGDWLLGDDSGNRIEGFEGNDILYGDDGDDTLHGGDGDDSLHGGDGDDILEGGAGADTYIGGLGADVFRILDVPAWSAASSLAEMDLILDFSTADGDLLQISEADGTLIGPGGRLPLLYGGVLAAQSFLAPGLALPGQAAGSGVYQAWWVPEADLDTGGATGAGWVVVDLDRDFTLSDADFVARIQSDAGTGGIGAADFVEGTFAARVGIAPATIAQAEGGPGAATRYVYTVTLDQAPTRELTLAWSVTGIGPNPADAFDFVGGDFVGDAPPALPSGVVTFAPGQISASITVEVRGDSLVEPDEGFAVTLLANPASGLVVSPFAGSAEGIIRNDDVPDVSDGLFWFA